MMITWRDVVSALALVASGVTLWLRVSDRLEKNRRARRHRELIEADPVDPFDQVSTDPTEEGRTGDDPAEGGEDEHDGGQDDGGTRQG